MEAYALDDQRRTARYNGVTTLAERIEYKVSTLKYQFLPHYFHGVPGWRLWLRSLGGPRTLPDFACVGAIKSGTSDLSTYLFQHPCILPPLSKEVTTGNTKEWLLYYPTVKEKEEAARRNGKALSGYFNPVMHSLTLIDAYHRAKPDAKIILMLRNPVDRAYSHYKWDLLIGGKKMLNHPYYKSFAGHVDMALDFFPAVPFPSAASKFELLQTGIYVKAVELWMDRFGRQNVHVLRAEDFFKDVQGTLCKIHEFLGIPPIKPELHEVMNQNPLKAPPFEKETRAKLKAFYRPWNEQLYALLDRDMGWD
ncbi:MAG: sulfotransferase domain-containing protein [Byssovorax sp.]